MFNPLHLLASAALVLLIPLTAAAHSDRGESYAKGDNNSASVQLGPRPF